jgi:hypothetical protein
MTSKELVGPLPTVSFGGGPDNYSRVWRERPKVAYTVPQDTRDPRYRTCTDHHVACDCREAEMAENINEWRHEYQALKAAVLSRIEGHATTGELYERVFNRWENDRQVWDYVETQERCECVACQIARECYL